VQSPPVRHPRAPTEQITRRKRKQTMSSILLSLLSPDLTHHRQTEAQRRPWQSSVHAKRCVHRTSLERAPSILTLLRGLSPALPAHSMCPIPLIVPHVIQSRRTPGTCQIQSIGALILEWRFAITLFQTSLVARSDSFLFWKPAAPLEIILCLGKCANPPSV